MIKFALAVPCHNFIENAFDVFEQHNRLGAMLDFETYSLEEVIVTEQNAETITIDADVIITRGLLAEILKSIQGDIPVVEIQVPATDTLRVVLNCVEKFHARKVGIIASHNMVMGATEISSFLDIPFQTYVLTTSWNGPQLVDQAIKDGCDTIVGGLNTCNYASSINIPNMFISTGRDSFWQSITAAKRAASISRAEQEKTKRLQVILNTSKEGLLSIDTLKRIRMINQSAERILNLNASLVGKRVMDAPFPIEFKKLLINDEACSNELFKYEDTYFNVNKYPIWVHQNNMGIVVSFQEVNDIVDLESSIRRKIHNKGHVAKTYFKDIIGQSQVMRRTIKTAEKYSCTDSNILLTGQSGTGKELFAQSIHNHSARKGGPFVAVNCAAIPESLLESELFGYESGAFTEAQKNGKPGYFELAHNGTLFLDEIGELPLNSRQSSCGQFRSVKSCGSEVTALSPSISESLPPPTGIWQIWLNGETFGRISTTGWMSCTSISRRSASALEIFRFWHVIFYQGIPHGSPLQTRHVRYSPVMNGPETSASFLISVNGWPSYAAGIPSPHLTLTMFCRFPAGQTNLRRIVCQNPCPVFRLKLCRIIKSVTKRQRRKNAKTSCGCFRKHAITGARRPNALKSAVQPFGAK